ncbi:MAG: hypothetical protein ABI852_09190 [Gemmatimonadaceae bacterium]
MSIHHDKRHTASVTNLNNAHETRPTLQKTLRELLTSLSAVADVARNAVRNNGGGHANHDCSCTCGTRWHRAARIHQPAPRLQQSTRILVR